MHHLLLHTAFWLDTHTDQQWQGPREDSGFSSDVNPGIQLVERIYNYCAKLHPKTKVMVSGIRRKEGGAPLTSHPPHCAENL